MPPDSVPATGQWPVSGLNLEDCWAACRRGLCLSMQAPRFGALVYIATQHLRKIIEGGGCSCRGVVHSSGIWLGQNAYCNKVVPSSTVLSSPKDANWSQFTLQCWQNVSDHAYVLGSVLPNLFIEKEFQRCHFAISSKKTRETYHTCELDRVTFWHCLIMLVSICLSSRKSLPRRSKTTWKASLRNQSSRPLRQWWVVKPLLLSKACVATRRPLLLSVPLLPDRLWWLMARPEETLAFCQAQSNMPLPWHLKKVFALWSRAVAVLRLFSIHFEIIQHQDVAMESSSNFPRSRSDPPRFLKAAREARRVWVAGCGRCTSSGTSPTWPAGVATWRTGSTAAIPDVAFHRLMEMSHSLQRKTELLASEQCRNAHLEAQLQMIERERELEVRESNIQRQMDELDLERQSTGDGGGGKEAGWTAEEKRGRSLKERSSTTSSWEG